MRNQPGVLRSLFLTGPMLVIGGFADGASRELIWALAAFIDLASPSLLRRRLRQMSFDSGHLAERFGLLLIIAMGESMVAIGVPAAEHLTTGVLAAVAIAFVLLGALWWVYFHFAADAVRHALATAQVQFDIARHVLSYGHLALVGSVIAIAVGIHEVVEHPSHHLDWGVTGLLYGGSALYLATYGYTRWMMFRLISSTRLLAAAAVLVLLPVAPLVSGLTANGSPRRRPRHAQQRRVDPGTTQHHRLGASY